MVQAARGGVQNIAEGGKANDTSKKFELKLVDVARASLEELRLDYEDYLRRAQLAALERRGPAPAGTGRPGAAKRWRRWRRGCGRCAGLGWMDRIDLMDWMEPAPDHP